MLSPSDLRRPLPDGMELLAGFDTGTFMSCAFTVVCDDPPCAFTIEEFPNYRYVGGEIELLDISTPEWARQVMAAYAKYKPGQSRLTGWVDTNTQFRAELAHYGINLLGNQRQLELRVEIAREYVLHNRYWMAPWLSVLPYEMENAQWPDDTTSAGKYVRLKRDDHTLDCVEHVLSRRPRTKRIVHGRPKTFLEQQMEQHKGFMPPVTDPHLGRL